MVVGLGNSGGDVCHELIGHASSISLSHNHGAIIVSFPLRGHGPRTDKSRHQEKSTACRSRTASHTDSS